MGGKNSKPATNTGTDGQAKARGINISIPNQNKTTTNQNDANKVAKDFKREEFQQRKKNTNQPKQEEVVIKKVKLIDDLIKPFLIDGHYVQTYDLKNDFYYRWTGNVRALQEAAKEAYRRVGDHLNKYGKPIQGKTGKPLDEKEISVLKTLVPAQFKARVTSTSYKDFNAFWNEVFKLEFKQQIEMFVNTHFPVEKVVFKESSRELIISMDDGIDALEPLINEMKKNVSNYKPETLDFKPNKKTIVNEWPRTKEECKDCELCGGAMQWVRMKNDAVLNRLGFTNLVANEKSGYEPGFQCDGEICRGKNKGKFHGFSYNTTFPFLACSKKKDPNCEGTHYCLRCAAVQDFEVVRRVPNIRNKVVKISKSSKKRAKKQKEEEVVKKYLKKDDDDTVVTEDHPIDNDKEVNPDMAKNALANTKADNN